jgi:GNAT superfamily N-acetyltransferase
VEGVSGSFSPPLPIDATHDTSGFSCGFDVLDDWLKAVALKSEGRSARTYVVCEGRAVVGYYCLATGSVSRSIAPGRLRRNAPDPLPVMVVGRLAVTGRCKGQGIGSAMLGDAVRRTLLATEIAGCAALVVHAIDDAAAAFYANHGFVESPAGPLTLFLPLETLRRSL